MEVELLHIAGCPGHEDALRDLRAALDAVGLGRVRVRDVMVRATSEPIPPGFAGSPTILVDGTDLFPGAIPLLHQACRVYRTDEGPVNSPTPAQIEAALRARELRPVCGPRAGGDDASRGTVNSSQGARWVRTAGAGGYAWRLKTLR